MVYMLLGDGFEEIEAITPLDLLKRAGVEVISVGIDNKKVLGSHGISIEADINIGEIDVTNLDMVIIPGGLRGVASLRANPQALDLLKFGWENGKYIAAICAGPTVLADLGITDGKNATCYPGQEKNMGSAVMHSDAAVITDDKLITAASAGCAIPFGLALISALKGQDAADIIAKQIVIR